MKTGLCAPRLQRDAQGGGGSSCSPNPCYAPLGLKSSPSSVTQRMLTSRLNASFLAVPASCNAFRVGTGVGDVATHHTTTPYMPLRFVPTLAAGILGVRLHCMCAI